MRLAIARYSVIFFPLAAAIACSAQSANIRWSSAASPASSVPLLHVVVAATPPQLLPAPPSGVTATVAGHTVTIQWTTVTGMQYSVFRSTGSNPGMTKLAGSLDAGNLDTAAYTDRTPGPGAHSYVVVATASNGYSSTVSAPAKVVVATASAPAEAPAAIVAAPASPPTALKSLPAAPVVAASKTKKTPSPQPAPPTATAASTLQTPAPASEPQSQPSQSPQQQAQAAPAAALPLTCPSAPVAGAPDPLPLGPATVTLFNNVSLDAATCASSTDAGCGNRKTEIGALQTKAAQLQAQELDCSINGLQLAGTPLSQSDSAYYAGRAAFWAKVLADLSQHQDAVSNGTYQVSAAVPALAYGVVLPPPPVPPSTPPVFSLNPIRVMGGIDVSASASTDPAAKFLLEGTFERPLTAGAGDVYSPLWVAADIRLASIAQPGAISGTSDLATYIKPLTDSTPSQLVQSGEAYFSTELNLLYPKNRPQGSRALNAHFIAEGGVVTPLSPSQVSPTIYTVTPALYSYYTAAGNSNGGAATAVNAACGTTFSTTTPCYVAYVPQGRTRFYRTWDSGLRLRIYDQASDKDGKPTSAYLFPSTVSLTVGQNEYVTGGEMRGFVLHAGGTLLIPTGVSSALAGWLYAYGAIDLNLNGKNQNSQQFLLQTAPSTVTSASSSVAVVSVASQVRDRYRFGIALDLAKVITILSGAANKPKP